MQISKLCLCLSLGFTFFTIGCAKDKNMNDYQGEQLQQSIARISAISGSYSGVALSKLDGASLGTFNLKFQAHTDIQSSATDVTNKQNVTVGGSLTLNSLTSSEITFDNGHYDDVTGEFQVTIPVAQDGGGAAAASLYLTGHITGDLWIGSLNNGQPQNGADLNLMKNAPVSNTPALEVGGTRLEQIRKLDYQFLGVYKIAGVETPFKLSFTDRDILPEQSLYKLFSPVRQVGVNCDLTGFELNFSNAVLDDNMGTLVAHDPTDQQGHPARASLSCKRFGEGVDFGWDCEIQTKTVLFRTHLIAKK